MDDSTTMSKELPETKKMTRDERYLDAVDNLAANKMSIPFESVEPNHAGAVLCSLLKYSNKEIRIYTHTLNGNIPGDNKNLKFELEEFLKQKRRLKIVVQTPHNHPSKSFNELLEKYREYIEVRIANEDFQKSIEKACKNEVFFAVNDESSYRIETTDTEKSKRKAIACFYDPPVAGNLSKVFKAGFKGLEIANL